MATKTKSTERPSGLSAEDAATVIEILQERLNAYNDLHLTLKHVHWNVVGPSFIGVHEMIDPEVDRVRLSADAVAERIATLGGSPRGTVGAITKTRDWADYPLGRALVPDHLAAIDREYDRVIADNRAAMDALEDADLVTQDLLIGQTGALEKFQWFVRAHLETAAK
ncbi:starvation-inducible DNA-binding protein [Propionicimonas paludicola]|uniref:Starvation-inducible DNA-binding protein n=1 Tax=Propionicimonas paludicola TaxID=185243 RepID=A0A2A9CVH0_9ACTN|nr:DNA starvation/stationary phase protection protein [Propionicimonas paludicola]PFG18146.1 starvation-inducible DNA-binding protein [Propionicimonas paludicola]